VTPGETVGRSGPAVAHPPAVLGPVSSGSLTNRGFRRPSALAVGPRAPPPARPRSRASSPSEGRDRMAQRVRACL